MRRAVASAGQPMGRSAAAAPSVPAAARSASTANWYGFFAEQFPKLRDFLAQDVMAEEGMPQESKEWISASLDYNVPKGKLNRGITVVETVAAMQGVTPDALPEDDGMLVDAAVAGWVLEWMQALFLVTDDVMDSSITRRGQPCWYRQPAIGLAAINDGLILRSHMTKLLNWRFRGEGSPAERVATGLTLMDLFNDVMFKTEMGQLLDLTSTPPSRRPEVARFTPERYWKIVEYKTAYYSFYLPVAAGLVVAGVNQPEQLRRIESILIEMGRYFQVQDDYLDCFGDPEVTGKVGTDIQDGKCSWLVVQALEAATPEQRATLEESYAIDDEEHIAKVKAIYEALDLPARFAAYEEESNAKLTRQIDELVAWQEEANLPEADRLPRQVMLNFMAKIYKRDK